MALRKDEGADLHQQYPIYAQLGIIVALLVLILAFRMNLYSEGEFQIMIEEQTVVELDDIQQTQLEMEPPPPPRPPAPRVVPDDTIIEEEPIDWDASLNLDEPLADRGPPAPEPEEDLSNEVFVIVEEQPELIGGMAALRDAINYPDFARRAGIQGTVFVEFIVDTDGSVREPRVTRGVHRLLDEEAIRAVSQMRFRPGMQRGQEVQVRMSLPVRFQLS